MHQHTHRCVGAHRHNPPHALAGVFSGARPIPHSGLPTSPSPSPFTQALGPWPRRQICLLQPAFLKLLLATLPSFNCAQCKRCISACQVRCKQSVVIPVVSTCATTHVYSVALAAAPQWARPCQTPYSWRRRPRTCGAAAARPLHGGPLHVEPLWHALLLLVQHLLLGLAEVGLWGGERGG